MSKGIHTEYDASSLPYLFIYLGVDLQTTVSGVLSRKRTFLIPTGDWEVEWDSSEKKLNL